MGELIENFEESPTLRLINRPSFLEGYSRLADNYGNLLNRYNYSETEEKADICSLRSDWSALNDDMKKSYSKVLEEYEQKEKTQA